MGICPVRYYRSPKFAVPERRPKTHHKICHPASPISPKNIPLPHTTRHQSCQSKVHNECVICCPLSIFFSPQLCGSIHSAQRRFFTFTTTHGGVR